MNQVGYAQIAAMLRGAAERLKGNHELLSRLDAATGDGDHGTTMVRVANALVASIDECNSKELAPFLEAVGWGVMSVDGGSTGPLIGSFFMGMSECLAGKNLLTAVELADAFEAGLAKMSVQTPAKVGDKTMIDALAPAVATMKSLAADGMGISAALAGAAEAAWKGAESTMSLQARFGRARNLGARTIGHLDPGSQSIAFIFAAFRDAVQ